MPLLRASALAAVSGSLAMLAFACSGSDAPSGVAASDASPQPPSAQDGGTSPTGTPPDGGPTPGPGGWDGAIDPNVPPAAALWASDGLPPFDAATVAHVLAVHTAGAAKGNRDDVFTKLGDSITASTSFLIDLGQGNYTLGAFGALDPTIKAFLGVTFDDNTNSFTRDGNAVQSGLTTRDVVKNLGWVTDEIRAIHPAWAIVMFGTDDLEIMEADEFRANYGKMLDAVEAEGTVPVLSTVPWRPEVQRAEELVPVFNAVVRDLAATRHLPYVDLVKLTDRLPARGLSSDNVHPSVETTADGGSLSADFTAAGLAYGYDVRNLTTVQMFDRLRALVRGDARGDASPAIVPPGAPSPVTCDAVHAQGCPAGSTCLLVNDVTVCGTPGAAKAGDACSNDRAAPVLCGAHDVCLDPGTCYAMCSEDADCQGPSVGPSDNRPRCASALTGGSFLLCTIPCNPVSAAGPSGCRADLGCGYYPATATSPQLTGCTAVGTGTAGQTCDENTICGAGLACLPAGASSGTCRTICRLGGSDCTTAGDVCTAPAGTQGAWFGFCCPGGRC